jgi:hypothetical protein
MPTNYKKPLPFRLPGQRLGDPHGTKKASRESL